MHKKIKNFNHINAVTIKKDHILRVEREKEKQKIN